MRNVRVVEERRRGDKRGPIRRVISTDGLGQRLKPFVLLDFVCADIADGWASGYHPYSGIATLTYHYAEDMQSAGGLEWMLAGGGVWHAHTIGNTGPITGFQLWLTLPPESEDGPSESRYISAHEVPFAGKTKVLLGSLNGVSSPIHPPRFVNCFDVSLAQSEQWTFEPPPGHEVAWLFVYQGEMTVSGTSLNDELAVLDRTEGVITLHAKTAAHALVGTAMRHDHPLIPGSNSVHTNMTSLMRGQRRIQQIAKRRQS